MKNYKKKLPQSWELEKRLDMTICKPSIKNQNFEEKNKPTNEDPLTHSITTDQMEIRKETGKFFQNIYNEQTNIDPSKDKIKEFLDMCDDSAPWEKLMNLKISKEHADAMEGDLTMSKLENSLFSHMNSSSNPGIDGLPVHM